MDLNDKEVKIIEKNTALKTDYETWEHFLNSFTKAIIVTDLEMEIISQNEQAIKLYHQLGREGKPGNLRDFYISVSKEVVDDQLRNVKQHGFSNYIYSVRNSDDTCSVELELNGLLDSYSKKIIYVLIPLKTESTRDHVKKDNLYVDIINDLKCYIVIHTKEGIIVDGNKAFCGLVKIERSKILGKSIYQFITAADKDKFDTVIKHLSSGNSRFNLFQLCLDSKEITYQYTTQFNFYSGLYYTIIYDCFEESEQNHYLIEGIQNVFCQSVDGIIMLDSKGIIVQANEQACILFEKTQVELINTNIEKITGEKINTLFILEEQESYELIFSSSSGKKKIIELTKSQISSSPYTLLICKDISEKWVMEQELLISENKFKKIFDGTFDGIMIWGADGEIYDINEPGAAIIGASIDHIQNKNFHEIFELTEHQMKHLQRHISLINKNKHHHFVCELTCRDGQNKQLDFSSRLDVIPGKNLTIFRDVTDKIRMEEQLKKSDTLNVVGELAAGIAHEIRNPMTALKGFIQLLEGSLNGEFSTYFQVISSELQRIETIITDFLILAKPQAVSYQIKQVNNTIENTLDLLSAQASMHNIQFHTHFSKIPPIHCESNQLKQVFINLIKNAIEAMPTGGFIDITTELFFDSHVLISIQDYGTGIPETVLDKLGEPFYTTKEKGTGLGLMVTYKIIEEHAGWIEVASEEEKGTLFQIYLPINHEFT
ncbi:MULTISPECIES: PAS domain S-box protein [Bacillaceae]|uniref:PAS domain S-box protein n=1 Tax=Bacillaceae TaxID=186817 RepID=UPI001CEF651C|nr:MULTISPECIES: PAS domain S-box protein [Bacillaceae]